MPDLVRVLVALLFVCIGTARSQQIDDLCVGQWVELKGALVADGRFEASAIEVLAPAERHTVVGAVTEVDAAARSFRILGLEATLGEPVRWDEGISFDTLTVGRRVKLEGAYRGAGSFVVREVAPRDAGRDRISGRIDRLATYSGGPEITVIGIDVRLAAAVEIENTAPFTDIALADEVRYANPQSARDNEDFVPGSIRIADGLTFGALIESKYTGEDEYDLRATRDRDLRKTRFTVRPQLLWTPNDRFSAMVSPRFEWNYRDAENGPDDWSSDVRLKELWVWTRDVADTGIDLQIGRQDFDDPREWIYKKDLDAVRAVWRGGGVRVEASVSAMLGEVNEPYDGEALNSILYVSNDDAKRHLAGWIVDRRVGGDYDSYPILFGARMLGEWLPETKSWLEASVVRGYEDDTNLRGYAFDVGATWTLFKPLYMNFGWAFGSADDPDSGDTDESYRQTGLERNNGKLGGVSSFRYYGEVLDPELSNLSVLTFGVGTRFTRDASLDLVWHAHDQVSAAAFMRRSDLKADPDGVHTQLGQEVDLILGLRDWHGSDFEFVAGWFDPGAAFADQDEAWKLSFQWRFRF